MSNWFKKTIVLGLDYSEFVGGINESKSKMQLLDAEFKLTAEEAKVFGNATDELKMKQENLTAKIKLQENVVRQMEEAYENTLKSEKATERQKDKSAAALLKEKAALQKMNNELEENKDKLKESEKKSDSFGNSIREMAEFLGINGSPAVEAFAKKFDSLDEKVGNTIVSIGAIVTTLGSLTMKTSENVKEINAVSQTMGMSTQQYQEWDYVLKTVGYDAESASGDLAALGEKAMDAAEGTGEGAEMFKKLGIRVKNTKGELKSQNELFSEVISKLQSMKDVTERNAIASALMSTTGEKLVPILNMTSEELENLKQKANDVGYVMDESTISKFNDLNNVMTEFDGVTQGLSNSFAVALLPILTGFFSVVSSIPTPVLQLLIVLTGMIVTIVSVTKAIKSVTDTGTGLAKFFGGLDTRALKTTLIIMGVVAALIALGVVIATIMGKADDLNRSMENIGSSVNNITNTANGKVQSTRYNAVGTDYFEGGETWVGENGPEIVRLPRGTRIYNANESERISNSSKVVNINYITIDAKNVDDFNRVVNLANGLHQARARGVVNY